ncbi:PH domain-containing protein [Pontimicrobium sp. MEBiC01747]
MNDFDFSNPSRQSVKGILVLFVLNTYKFVKKSITLLLVFTYSLFQKGSVFGFSKNRIMLLFAGVILIMLIKAILKYLNFTFYISKDDFHLSTGILKKETILIPKSKIQNVYIKQNIFQQLINVVQVNIETAGDNSTEISIAALQRKKALQLKEALFLNSKIIDTEIVEPQERESAKNNVFYEASIKKLLLEGISQNHLQSFFIIVAFIGGLYTNFKDFVKQLDWQDYFGEWFKMDESSFLKMLLFNSFIIIVLVITTFLVSLIKTVIVNYNLKVVDNNKSIEITKGLLNKVSLNLTPSRIQNIQITTNKVKQYLGLHTMNFKQAMVAKKEQKHFSIIGLGKAQIDYLVQRLYSAFNKDLQRYKPEWYYKRILILKTIPVLIIINALAFSFFEIYFWLVNLLFIPYLILAIQSRYNKAFYTMDDNYLSVGSGGILSSSIELLEIHKIQTVSIVQSIFQKRRYIASVKIATSSKTITIPYVKAQQAKTIADYLLYKVESQRLDWM